jgi:hypothetical protein
MNSNDPTYAYTELAPPDSIRLLELLPGLKGSPLKCNIIIAQLGDNPTYEALSYAWGDPTRLYLIQEMSTDTVLNIATNIHEALQAIREEQKPRILWADAICIDQSNTVERGSQVALMGQIYSDAQRVAVWLPCRKAVQILNDFVDAAKLWENKRNLTTKMQTSMRRMIFLRIFELPWSVLSLSLLISSQNLAHMWLGFGVRSYLLTGLLPQVRTSLG